MAQQMVIEEGGCYERSDCGRQIHGAVQPGKHFEFMRSFYAPEMVSVEGRR